LKLEKFCGRIRTATARILRLLKTTTTKTFFLVKFCVVFNENGNKLFFSKKVIETLITILRALLYQVEASRR